MKKLYYNIKFWYKLKFNRPIYRVDVLRAVKYNYDDYKMGGICFSIISIGVHYKLKIPVRCVHLKQVFPKLHYTYAKPFCNADDNYDNGYWWKFGDWTGGRMKFLDWLISEYKNDKEDLRYF
jgi:hypothetical protein